MDREFAVVTRDCEEQDPFDDLDTLDSSSGELEDLVHQLMPAEERCSVSEYIYGDNDLSVCSEQDDEGWEDQFFSSITSAGASLCIDPGETE